MDSTPATREAGSSNPGDLLTGKLHCLVAFDWGDEIDLERASQLVPAEVGLLPRRRRTPVSISYRPAPLRYELPSRTLSVGLPTPTEADAMVFDFGAVTLSFRTPFSLTRAQLQQLAVQLSEQTSIVAEGRAALEPLFRQLQPAIDEPCWHELYEDYFVFEFDPQPSFFRGEQPEPQDAAWLAGLLRMESAPLSAEEREDALKHRISYGCRDLVLIDSSVAVVIDEDCEETLRTIEFANLQLLEYRLLDRKVEEALLAAREQIQVATRSWLQFWRTHARPLRLLNEMRMDVVGTYERASSALQLVGDQYIARVYRLLGVRFHLEQWATNVRQALDVAEGVHETLSSQSAMYRLEILEITVIVLILIEIIIAAVGH